MQTWWLAQSGQVWPASDTKTPPACIPSPAINAADHENGRLSTHRVRFPAQATSHAGDNIIEPRRIDGLLLCWCLEVNSPFSAAIFSSSLEDSRCAVGEALRLFPSDELVDQSTRIAPSDVLVRGYACGGGGGLLFK